MLPRSFYKLPYVAIDSHIHVPCEYLKAFYTVVGTPIKDIYRAKFSSATVCFQKYSTEKTREYLEKVWKQPTYEVRHYGIQGTDELVQLLSKLSGKPVPDTMVKERQKLLAAMAASGQGTSSLLLKPTV